MHEQSEPPLMIALLSNGGCSRLREFMQRHWHPTSITAPTVDPDLEQMNGAQRTAEAVRYSILSLEWWLSPNGTLREWAKLNGKVASILLMPAVLVLPLAALILWQLLKLVTWIVVIAGKLTIAFTAIIVAFVVVALTRTFGSR